MGEIAAGLIIGVFITKVISLIIYRRKPHKSDAREIQRIKDARAKQ